MELTTFQKLFNNLELGQKQQYLMIAQDDVPSALRYLKLVTSPHYRMARPEARLFFKENF